MKNFYFNIQSKGGAGKSMLTYLLALKHEENQQTAFIDLDSATHTSSKQLRFLDKEKYRLFEVDILDEIKKIEREKLFSVLEMSNQMEFENFYIDFGAAESEQLLRLLSMDFTIAEFKEFESLIDAKIIFNVIMAGGTSYVACFDYLKQLVDLLDGQFPVYIYANEFTFKNQRGLIEELEDFKDRSFNTIQEVIPFGNLYPERVSSLQITENMKAGKGKAGFTSFAAKIILRKEILKLDAGTKNN
ncbi:MAG TPA: hypothetical protein DCQ50_08480 [Chryseobacterium sp.]|nr:hypothetical protein [Chryseobacterium sp.]